jgi:MFS transporter, DHA3 family, tetracycline resistance protein
MQNRDSYRVFLVYSAVTSCLSLMMFTASSIYQVTMAGLNPLQLVLIGTMLELSVFLFEVPTGVVADSYSRRLSIIIGTFLIGAGFLVEGSFPAFGPILIAQLVWGVGYTFTSGAFQAWISDEIGEENAGKAFLRGAQIEQISGLLGIGIGTLIGAIRINLPILLSGALFLLFGLTLIFSMREHGFQPAPHGDRTPWMHFIHIFNSGAAVVRKRPSLQNILWIGFVFGLYSEGFDRLWTAHLLHNFTMPWLQPVIWFGLMRAAEMLLSAGANEIVQRKLNLTSTRSLIQGLGLCSLGVMAALLLFSQVGWFGMAVALYIIISILRSRISPLYTTWVNQRLDPQVRATIISMSSQVDAIGQISGGPLIGIVAQQISLRAGLFGSAVLLSPVLLLFERQFHRE